MLIFSPTSMVLPFIRTRKLIYKGFLGILAGIMLYILLRFIFAETCETAIGY